MDQKKGDLKCMYKQAQMLFCGEGCNANFDEAKHCFELTKESNEIRIFFLRTLEKM